MADGLYYVDLREPHNITDGSSITLAATMKALYTVALFPVLGTNYFSRPGKKLRIRAFGRMTTGITPGNFSWSLFWGSTIADATGTLLGTSSAQALTASKTNLTWEIDCRIVSRVQGASGSLLATGKAILNGGLMTSACLLPDSAPAVVTSDLTIAGVLSIQAARSGSTAETMQVHELEVEAMN